MQCLKNFIIGLLVNITKLRTHLEIIGALGEVLTYGLNKYLQQKGIPLRVQDCIKGQIVDRIELDLHLMAQNRRYILKKCNYMIDAYKGAVWEERKRKCKA